MTDSVLQVVGRNGAGRVPPGGPRIVSLVPSLTELLFALELGGCLVGRTQYCVHPPAAADITSVGGTKKVNQGRLRALRPTHVVLNVDENPRELAERLRGSVDRLVITHPLGPDDNLMLFRGFGEEFDRPRQARRLADEYRAARRRLTALAALPRCRVLYLIWRDPWMTVARDTYIGRMLAAAGFDTWPAVDGGPTGAARYPTVDIDANLLAGGAFDLVLFSSEPYRFTAADRRAFADRYRCAPERLLAVDGEMVSWYGSRAAQGLDYLRRLRLQLADQPGWR